MSFRLWVSFGIEALIHMGGPNDGMRPLFRQGERKPFAISHQVLDWADGRKLGADGAFQCNSMPPSTLIACPVTFSAVAK